MQTPPYADSGLERAFTRLWRRYYRRLWVFVRSYAAMSSEEAEDAVQEIMMKVYGALGRLDPNRPTAPWVFRIARNHCIDGLRASVPRRAAEAPDGALDLIPDPARGPHETLARANDTADVRRFLGTLSPEDRQVLYLAYYEGFRMRDIAEALEMPEGTVKYRVHALKGRLREWWEAAR